MKTRTVAVESLIYDERLHARANVDSTHVNDLVRAIKGGAKLPPIAVWKRKIIDGVHRRDAYLACGFTECTVIDLECASAADALAEAIKLNAAHGLKIGAQDRVAIVLKADACKLPRERVAELLHIPIKLVVREVESRTASTEASKAIVLKTAAKHLAGKTLTVKQVEAISSLGGDSQRRMVEELISLIEGELLDHENEAMMERLAHLGELIQAEVAVC